MKAPSQMDGGVFSTKVDPFLMANLYPRSTGLPMTVWIGPNTSGEIEASVKVSMAHGESMDADNLATVSVRPKPKLLHGKLSGPDVAAVAEWIELNRDLIVDYWEDVASTVDLVTRLKRLD